MPDRGGVIAGALLLAALPAQASEVMNIPIIEAPPGTPALGGGLRLSGNPLATEADTRDLVPLYLYEGRRLFAHGTEFGAYLYRDDLFTLAAFGRARFTSVKAGDDPLHANLKDRRQTLDGGVLAQLRGGWGQVQAEWLTDLLGRHEGQEANLTYRYRWEVNDNLTLSPFLTWTWQDSRLAGYYFGVDPQETAPGLAPYDPGDAHNFSYGINAWYRLSDHVFLFANLGSTSWDSAIRNSPLVESGRQVEAFVGAGYLFGNVHKSDRVEKGREGEWTWRVNAGYLAKQNIVPHFMVGNWEASEHANTPLAGFTLGRLLNGGPRVDFYGRIALFRHFERDFQDDFWNYTAYIMAMGKGYFPWSDQPAFRYGFGFGISYAEEVPTVETIKQARHDGNTSRLLNYLEFQVDFPIDRLIPAKSLRNCFTGITVVHRSGIFGTADILGQVAGGSDWMTFHLECLR